MTSRERVRAVLNHEIPDYAPNGLGGCETAGLHVLAYDKLQDILGVPKTPPRIDTFMVNAVFENDVITAMEGDVLLLSSPRMCRSRLRGTGFEAEWKLQELWNKQFRVSTKEQFTLNQDGSITWDSTATTCPSGAYFFDSLEKTNLLADFDFPSPEQYHPQSDFSDKILRSLEETAKQLYHETTFSICLGETITDLQYIPGGLVGGMIYLMEDPDGMKEILQKSVDAALSQLRLLEQAVGKYVDILSIAHDFGDNRGVTIGEPLWRKIYKPYYFQLFQGWKKISNMKINMHSCGAIHGILPDLMECGLDIYNPVQISSNGMNPKELKEKFGKDLVFWGGAYDTQLNPVSDSYDTVYRRVYDTIKTFSKDGGYIMAGVHNLPPEVPAAHLKAVLDAWKAAR